MLIKDSAKYHPEFDIAEARRIFAASGHDKELEGESITSPYDLFSVEELRERLGLRIGPAIPTDIFVFGKGEPEKPDCTKIGGLPYWPADRTWPKDDEGRPLRFVAQFNFTDSKDIVADLPGDVLLLLVDDGWDWADMSHFEWVKSGRIPTSNLDPSLVTIEQGPFFGAIYRTVDFPDAMEKARESLLDEEEEPEIDEFWLLPVLNGTKIGGLPHIIQNEDDVYGESIDGEFICQLGSIQAAPNAPYPWFNHPEALRLGSGADGIHCRDNELCIGDMGSLYIYRDPNGNIKSFAECY
jgi:hypothetical protein